MANAQLTDIASIPEEVFEHKVGLGGDTGRGELPNIPATVETSQDYAGMMQPVSQSMQPDEVERYGSKTLGLPISAPPIHQLSILAGQYSPDNNSLNNERARQVGASLVRRQMSNSKDRAWTAEPLFRDYISSLGLNAGRSDTWDQDLRRLYGI